MCKELSRAASLLSKLSTALYALRCMGGKQDTDLYKDTDHKFNIKPELDYFQVAVTSARVACCETGGRGGGRMR